MKIGQSEEGRDQFMLIIADEQTIKTSTSTKPRSPRSAIRAKPPMPRPTR